jgi:hypothetical protein
VGFEDSGAGAPYAGSRVGILTFFSLSTRLP